MLIASLIVGIGIGSIFFLIPALMATSTQPFVLTVDNLKDSYKVGENITFTVNAIGRLDKQCNDDLYPDVTITSEKPVTSDNFDRVFYENRAPLLGFSCDNTPALISSHWAYPSPRDSELWGQNSTKTVLTMNTPGSYLLTVRYHGASITKSYSVTQR